MERTQRVMKADGRAGWRAPLAAALVAAWFSWGGAATARAQLSLSEDFEGAKISWRPDASDGAYKTLLHRRLRQGGKRGPGCEQIQVTAQNNTYVYFAYPTPQARLLDELRASVFVLSDQEGVQLLARVVLPRSLDPRTRRPRTVYLRGASYSRAGAWEELRLERLPALLSRQTPALRAEYKADVDTSEAYLEALVLNVYGGPGTSTVWIDGLDISPVVDPSAVGGSSVVPAAAQFDEPPAPGAANPPGGRSVAMQGSIVNVAGRAFVPRLIEYRGEPLAWLAERGFNGIWSADPLPPATMNEAARARFAVVCPPPASPADALTSPYDGVVAWHIGRRLTHDEFDAVRERVVALRRADTQGRPIVGEVDADLRLYSRYVDVLLLRRDPLGTSLELSDYAQWLRRRPALARPGTPAWTVIQTQYDPALLAQWRAIGVGDGFAPSPEPEQIRLLTLSAVAAGTHGFLFRSDTRLDAEDPPTRVRALALELLNLELTVLEPWLRGGQLVAHVTGNPPQVNAALVQLDRARLLIPIWSGRGAQYVPGQSSARDVTFVVPGVPEPHKAYEATPAGLQPLDSSRIAGGKRLVLSEFGLASAIIFAPDQDPQVLVGLNQKLRQSNVKIAELARQLTVAKLVSSQAVLRQLDTAAQKQAVESGWLSGAQSGLDQCARLQAAGDHATAAMVADRALRPLRLLQRAQWTSSVEGTGSPESIPAGVSFAMLPAHWFLTRQIASAGVGPNRLPGGDMEDLDLCLRSGWRHVQSPRVELALDVGLVADDPHGGRRALRLSCEPRNPEEAPTMLEGPVAWIETAPVAVPPNSWVRLRGYVRVPRPIAASVDGLMVMDNCGGSALAERFGKTEGWQEFTLYRMAPASGPIVLTFALAGLGEAWIDDITIEPLTLAPPPTARLAPLAPSPRFAPPGLRR